MNDEQSQFDENCKWLNEQGWKLWPINSFDTCDKVWYKQYPNVKPLCYSNDKLQLGLKVWTNTNIQRISFQIELCAEPDDGVWIHFITYSLTNDNLINELENQVQKLIRAWIACQSKT